MIPFGGSSLLFLLAIIMVSINSRARSSTQITMRIAVATEKPMVCAVLATMAIP